MTDTMEEATTEAMVNTSATGNFIDQDFIDQMKLPTWKLFSQSRSIVWTGPQTKLAALTRWSTLL
jgi:hypothetical protein